MITAFTHYLYHNCTEWKHSTKSIISGNEQAMTDWNQTVICCLYKATTVAAPTVQSDAWQREFMQRYILYPENTIFMVRGFSCAEKTPSASMDQLFHNNWLVLFILHITTEYEERMFVEDSGGSWQLPEVRPNPF